MSHGYKFYIQRVEWDAENKLYLPDESSTIDLEAYYNGLKYARLTGINDIGKTKNIYTEKFPESDRLRVYIPKVAQYEATTMTLTLYFFGKNRQQVFNDFVNEIKTGIHRYRDTARQYYFDFIVDDELKPSDENWYSGQPYFKVDVKMKNIYGECYDFSSSNLLTNGADSLNNDKYELGIYHLGAIRPVEGELVEFSFSGYISQDNESVSPPIKGYDVLRIYNSGWAKKLVDVKPEHYDKTAGRFIVRFNWSVGNSANNSLYIFQGTDQNMPVPDGWRKGMSHVYDAKLEIVKTKTI